MEKCKDCIDLDVIKRTPEDVGFNGYLHLDNQMCIGEIKLRYAGDTDNYRCFGRESHTGWGQTPLYMIDRLNQADSDLYALALKAAVSKGYPLPPAVYRYIARWMAVAVLKHGEDRSRSMYLERTAAIIKELIMMEEQQRVRMLIV